MIKQGGRPAHDGDPVLPHPLQYPRGVELPVVKDDLRPRQQGQQEFPHQHRAVVQRPRDEKAVLLADGEIPPDIPQVGQQAVLGEHGALGRAGGSAGAQDERHVPQLLLLRTRLPFPAYPVVPQQMGQTCEPDYLADVLFPIAEGEGNGGLSRVQAGQQRSGAVQPRFAQNTVFCFRQRSPQRLRLRKQLPDGDGLVPAPQKLVGVPGRLLAENLVQSHQTASFS